MPLVTQVYLYFVQIQLFPHLAALDLQAVVAAFHGVHRDVGRRQPRPHLLPGTVVAELVARAAHKQDRQLQRRQRLVPQLVLPSEQYGSAEG